MRRRIILEKVDQFDISAASEVIDYVCDQLCRGRFRLHSVMSWTAGALHLDY